MQKIKLLAATLILSIMTLSINAQFLPGGTPSATYTTDDVGIDIDNPNGKLHIVKDNTNFVSAPHLLLSTLCPSEFFVDYNPWLSSTGKPLSYDFSITPNCINELEFNSESSTDTYTKL
jgi:hypothetical protein